jgi:hypothetical protein
LYFYEVLIVRFKGPRPITMAWSSIGTRKNFIHFHEKNEKEMLDKPIPCPKALQEISKSVFGGLLMSTRGLLDLL